MPGADGANCDRRSDGAAGQARDVHESERGYGAGAGERVRSAAGIGPDRDSGRDGFSAGHAADSYAAKFGGAYLNRVDYRGAGYAGFFPYPDRRGPGAESQRRQGISAGADEE